jgi:hypothetical protein
VPFPEESGDCSLWMSRLLGEGCSTSAVTLTGVWALSFLGHSNAPTPRPALRRTNKMKRVAVLLLLLSLAIAAPAFAAGIWKFVNAGVFLCSLN